MSFTDQIADYIKENNLELKNLTIILPSERAKKYISASLFKRYGRPILAPEMITIDRWVKGLSDKTVVDKTRLLIKLFSIQQQDPSQLDNSFDEFLTWGNLLLSDFDEIDRYMLDSKQVFKNLADIKEIENWSFGEDRELSPGQKRFMEFWEKIPIYYQKLNDLLDKEKVCYMGKAYRFVAENPDVVFKKNKEQIFLFAGFNALSKAEMDIMRQLHRLGRAHILINADEFYLNENNHEAGRFMRNLLSYLDVKTLPFVSNKLLKNEKSINIIECAQNTGQVKVASTLLEGLNSEELSETLLLLADESLINPVLKNLPKSIGKANITLGLPLKNTSIRTWVELLFSIQENKVRFNTSSIYCRDLQKLWNHPLFVGILNSEQSLKITEFQNDQIRRNKIFQNSSSVSLGEVQDNLLELMISSWNNDWTLAIDNIRKMNDLIFQNLKEKDLFEKAIVYEFDRSLIDFQNIVHEGLPQMNIRSFKHLFQLHWSSHSIAYHGNPMDGLQIMGLLETRLLDFKKIIVLGLNEGKMPPTNPIQTMIPMDLRKYHGLPTPRDKQGLFAHHFYRLLHSCEQMWVTFTSSKENIGSNEESRYLLQLELELSRQNPGIKIDRQFYSIPDETGSNELLSIEKNDEIFLRMDELHSRSVSASALKKYLECPLDYYYRYVLDFGEEESLEEEIESNTFGSFIHQVLEDLYRPFARRDNKGNPVVPQPRNITSFDIDDMLKKYEMMITKEFLKHFNNDRSSFDSGKNLLSYEMAKELTKRILLQEKEFLSKQTESVFIEYLEVNFEKSLELEIHGNKKQFNIKGTIDRIDSIGNKFRIIDYKSGKVEDDEVRSTHTEIEGLVKSFGSKKHVLQLLFYAFLYENAVGQIPNEVGIVSLVRPSSGVFPLTLTKSDLQQAVKDFPEALSQIFEEMYSKEIPFEHVPKQFSYCKYCE